jgi:hypothetical protein
MAETGEAAVGLIHGDKTYQQRARLILPILVRQAQAQQKISYGQLADELGISNPRTLNWPLGSIGNTILDLAAKWDRKIPPIQAIVINQSSGLPGEGISWFAPDAAEFKNASLEERERIVDYMLHEIYLFKDWEHVLKALGLPPVPTPPLPDPKDVAPRGLGGEGELHRALKLAVAENPSWIRLPGRCAPGNVEALLMSGDSLDVEFRHGSRRIGVEVKTGEAGVNEITRGLFQCVKYKAVLRAESRASGSRASSEVILALGGPFPAALVPLRNTLRVEVIENVGEGVV